MNDMTQPKEEMAIMVGDQMYTQQEFAQMKRAETAKLYSVFAKMRDDWVQHRAQSGVESRMRRANDLYLGRDASDDVGFVDTLKNGPPNQKKAGAPRSRVVVNIVRPKVDQAKARMCEILLPVDDRNWGIKPTPIPEIKDMTGNKTPTVDPATGQPTGLTADDEARFVIEAAKKASDAMQESIDDSLTECNFNGESRNMVENGVLLGTGVMYGPFPENQTSRVWIPEADGSQRMQENSSIVPSSASLDPWNVYFDPSCGNNHQRGRGFFIKRDVTRKELRRLIGLPGYDEEAIKSVLMNQPCRVRVAEGRVVRETIRNDSYEMWTYHGEIEPDEMETLSERMGDPLTDVSFGVLVMINDVVIGAMDSWVADKSLPVDVWNWRKADDSPFGYGLPDELEHQQRVVNAAWRQVMDNGRTSLGGQIVMKKGTILPQDGNYEIVPNKVWLAKDDTVDVKQAFAVFEFNSHLQELLAVAQAAMQFADQETSMPQMMGGEKGTAPETVGGMIMLSNNSNTVLRMRVKLYDDCVTKPHIRRYYDWKMMNDENPDIKGDYEIDARGSTALIERDLANQGMLNLANITSNPRYIPHLDDRKELTAILKAFKINPEEVMKDEAKAEQDMQAMAEQGPPPDPRMAAAEMNMQAKQLELEDREKQRQADAARAEQDMQVRRETLQYNREREQSESNIAMTEAQLSREIAMAELAQDGQLSQAEMESRERLALVKIDNDRQLFTAEAAIKAQQGSGI